MSSSLYDPAVQHAMKAAPSITTTANGTQIPYPFPSPADWRDHWIYFLLVDRFNNPTASPDPDIYPCFDYQGGNFEGIKQQLPYLKELGVGAIWISPVLMNPQWFKPYWGGYGTLDFLRIEPRFCSDPARALNDPPYAAGEFRSLVDEAHAHGIYVILDIVLNHTGDVFSYKDHGNTADWDPHNKYEIRWRDGAGVPQQSWTDIASVANLPADAGIWPKELHRNEYFRSQGGDENNGDFSRMKELVTEYKDPSTGAYEVRNHLILAYQYLIAAFDLDGYRIDTLMYIEADFARVFGNAMREYALSIGKRNFFTFGEVWKDDDEEKIAEFIGRNTEKDHEFIGVDAAIDFPLRKRLVNVCKGSAPPADLAQHFDYRRETLKKIVSSHGDAGRYYVTFLDNHDLAKRFHISSSPGQTVIALSCLMTLQGIPCIYYGSEQGLDNHEHTEDFREYSREALWGEPNAFNTQNEFFKLIKELTTVRSTEPALRYGRQYFRPCSGNGIDFGYSPYKKGILAFSRILNNQEMLIVANTHPAESNFIHIAVDFNLHGDGMQWQIIFPFAQQGNIAGTTNTLNAYRAVGINVSPMEVLILKPVS
jgi:glycosidase